MQTDIPYIIQPGLYRHYKGNMYRVIGEVLNATTDEIMILYQSEAGDYFCRGLEDWINPVYKDGQVLERFRFIRAIES